MAERMKEKGSKRDKLEEDGGTQPDGKKRKEKRTKKKRKIVGTTSHFCEGEESSSCQLTKLELTRLQYKI